jgi:uncharacterized protein (TIGR02246 family)
MTESAITTLYHDLLNAWDRRDAAAFAALFIEDGFVVGFDGSQMNGRAEIESTLSKIFADHMTATYVGKVKHVRFISADAAVLRAVAGLLPRGQSDINPAANAIQLLVATQQDGMWRIVHYQNTPAQFHGRPDLAEALTNELRAQLNA